MNFLFRRMTTTFALAAFVTTGSFIDNDDASAAERQQSNSLPAAAPFEAEIAAFERADAKAPPPSDALLFIGSSSFRMWSHLAEDFPAHVVINRGFGGSQLSDSVHYAPRIVWPYRPRMILLYAGDNDLAEGKTPERIEADWIEFVRVVRQKSAAPIAFVSIKPSPARAALMPLAHQTNERIRRWCEEHPGDKVLFIDVWHAMLDAQGQPRAELFGDDRLHLNRQGYVLWKRIVAPHLPQ